MGISQSRKMPKIRIQCKQCGKIFKSLASKNRKFCERKCYNKYWVENISIASKIKGTRNKKYTCKSCGMEFIDYEINQRKYCTECSHKKTRFRKGENKGKDNPKWIGGKINSSGYKKTWISKLQKYKFEHRLVMEKHLGRELKKDEIIHHINGQKQDNRIENLIIMNRGTHSNAHVYRTNCPRCSFLFEIYTQLNSGRIKQKGGEMYE